MDKKIILTGLSFGILAIIFGAFGAHALKKFLTVEQLTTFEVGVRYLMYQGLFLLFIGSTTLISLKGKRLVFYLNLLGAFLFSGSIFLLSTSSITLLKINIIGPLTPVGGLLIIISWGIVFYSIITKKL
jgi:uncharacterized membrane protein YgdD (TMEM256/DUF423 family)